MGCGVRAWMQTCPAFGHLLKAHIHREAQQLFEQMQAACEPGELETLGARVAAAHDAADGPAPRNGTARAHLRPPGADPGRAQRRLPPGLPRPAVPVPEHRPRPDRPSRRLLWPRGADRRADHLPDPPVPTRPARRRGGHRHHQSRDLGPPPHGHPRRSRTPALQGSSCRSVCRRNDALGELAAQEPPARPTPRPPPAHSARSRHCGRGPPATPPKKAAHTATGGARGRNRTRSPVRVADGGLNGARRRPSSMNYSQTMPSLSASRMWR